MRDCTASTHPLCRTEGQIQRGCRALKWGCAESDLKAGSPEPERLLWQAVPRHHGPWLRCSSWRVFTPPHLATGKSIFLTWETQSDILLSIPSMAFWPVE